MSKLTLNNVGSLIDATTAANTINNNSDSIESAMENTLSRDGTYPNQMGSNLDMNSKQILNLPAPATNDSPLRLQDLEDFIGGGTISTVPSGGTTGQSLQKSSNTDFDMDWGNSVSSVGLSLPNDFNITNSPVTNTGILTGAWAIAPTGTGSIVRATSPVLVTPNLGTPSTAVLTNATGTAAGLTAGHTTTNANLTGPITSVGNATSVAAQTGTGSTFVMNTAPTIGTSLGVTGPITGTSSSGSALAVGPNGSSNPVFSVDGSAGSSVAGLKVVGASTGGSVNIATTDSGSNNSLLINAKGTGTIGIGSASTGAVTITPATTVTGALTLGSTVNKVTLTAPATTATLTLANNITVTGPATNDTLVGKATTDTFTNKTLDVTGTGNSLITPYFSASLSGAQSTTSGVSNKILCNTELVDNKNWYDNVTNYRFTPQLAGKYRIFGQMSGNGTALTEIDISIYKNGSLYSQSFNVSAGVTALSININQVVSFNGSTDYVELFAAVFGTGSLSFLGGSAPIRTWFEAQYIGA